MIANDSPYNLANKLASFFIKENKRNGFYIEAGSNNGIFQSNTLFLETEMGWSGLLIEPNKQAFTESIKNRSDRNYFFNCALAEQELDGQSVFGYLSETDYENSLMGQIITNNGLFINENSRWLNKQKSEVAARSLSSILDEIGVRHVDFFSLDVEGYEQNVLNGIDFSKHNIELICLESWKEEAENFFLVKQILESENYLLHTRITERDYLFKKY